jgi:hypothetical protein
MVILLPLLPFIPFCYSLDDDASSSNGEEGIYRNGRRSG